MNAWVLAARPKTLPAAIAPVVVGSALAWKLTAQFSWLLAIATMLSATAIQIATNFFNDAIDADKGADTAQRLGPTRATAAGITSRRAMYAAGGITLALAIVCSVPLLMMRGWVMLVIGIPSLYFCFGYTGGPLPLAYRGLGDFFVLLFFGLVAVTGTVFVQCGQWLWEAVCAGLQLGMLSTVLIALNNLRDVAEDTLSHKRTLAVRFGITFSRVEITALCVLPILLGCVFWTGTCARWPLPVVALSCFISWKVWTTPPSRAYNRLLALAALQLVLFTILFTLACLK